MDAWYRSSWSLFEGDKKPKIKWVPRQLTMIDHDFLDNNHNGHLASDTLWMLDMALFQESLSLPKKRPGRVVHRADGDADGQIWSSDLTLYLPQSREQFVRGMERNVNRLLYALILRKNVTNLYPNLTREELQTPPDPEQTVRYAQDFLKAYPELATDDGILFHSDVVADNDTDLVCAPKLAAGFKTGFSIDERTCRELRSRTYEAYGIQRPDVEWVGQIKFPHPKKSVLILDRHFTRKIANADELYQGLKEKLKPYDVPVTYINTTKLRSAEEFVRLYSSAGIIISPHGSQNMGQMWMQRHSALIEIMPVGYTEYSFHMLSIPCKIWFYEHHSSAIIKDKEKYELKCGHKKPFMYSPCTEYKSENVWVKVDKIMPTILHALERLGYHTSAIWFDDIYPLEGDNKTNASSPTT